MRKAVTSVSVDISYGDRASASWLRIDESHRNCLRDSYFDFSTFSSTRLVLPPPGRRQPPNRRPRTLLRMSWTTCEVWMARLRILLLRCSRLERPWPLKEGRGWTILKCCKDGVLPLQRLLKVGCRLHLRRRQGLHYNQEFRSIP